MAISPEPQTTMGDLLLMADNTEAEARECDELIATMPECASKRRLVDDAAGLRRDAAAMRAGAEAMRLAPELYEALKAHTRVMGQLAMRVVIGAQPGKELEHAVNVAQDTARALLAKVEGR